MLMYSVLKIGAKLQGIVKYTLLEGDKTAVEVAICAALIIIKIKAMP